jgi:hypothetical protein
MKHIKLFESFKILENADRHKYYVVSYQTQLAYDQKRQRIKSGSMSWDDAVRVQQAHINRGAHAAGIYAVKDGREVSIAWSSNKENGDS